MYIHIYIDPTQHANVPNDMVFHFNPVISLLDSYELKKDILFVLLVTVKFSTAVCQCENVAILILFCK